MCIHIHMQIHTWYIQKYEYIYIYTYGHVYIYIYIWYHPSVWLAQRGRGAAEEMGGLNEINDNESFRGNQ